MGEIGERMLRNIANPGGEFVARCMHVKCQLERLGSLVSTASDSMLYWV